MRCSPLRQTPPISKLSLAPGTLLLHRATGVTTGFGAVFRSSDTGYAWSIEFSLRARSGLQLTERT